MAEDSGPRPPLASPFECSSDRDISTGDKDTSMTGLVSPGINIEFHGDPREDRPQLVAALSAPAGQQQFQSPIRHHKRTPSAHRQVKETLNARSEYASDESDGRSHHRINQYVIKEEIGRGSYGAVHLATDQFGNEYAVKEFSKARLRKRAQSNILRLGPRGPGQFPPQPGTGLGGHRTARLNDQEASEARDALFLIREEIAIMKKLNHPNLVQLIEVLDDPEQDSLYMVLEMCKKGVIMKVGVHEPADPYPVDSCRCWFRDLILGIEYLHAQGVVHRDIKPDNLLLTDDDVLKIVDFGVSEMFEKPDQMRTAKTAGSPAFLPPELCIARHGDVSGKAADIWSMGVCLYCLRYGRIPFERTGILDMYEAIKTELVKSPPDEDPNFVDIMAKILEKDPEKRITMAELREHPWVTKGGQDPLLSFEENCAEPVAIPNALELNRTFTRKMNHLLSVMKAISRFKSLLSPKDVEARPYDPMARSEGGDETGKQPQSESGTATDALDPIQEAEKSAAHYAAHVLKERERFLKARDASVAAGGEKGHARDPTDVEPLLLGIGTGGRDDFSTVEVEKTPGDIVSDSPTAVDFNVYDRAFEAEVEKIKTTSSTRRGGTSNRMRGGGGGTGTLYLTKHLSKKDQYRADENVTWIGGVDSGSSGSSAADTPRALAGPSRTSGSKFADVVAKAIDDAKTKAQEVKK